MKEGIFIIIINKFEAFALRKKGFGEHVHNGSGTYYRYYLTENKEVLKALEKYRESVKIK